MKKVKIGLTCSPSHIVSRKDFKVTSILISYGGGLGGTHEMYYATDIKKVKDSKMIKIKTFLGEIVELNEDFIVSKKEAEVIKQVSDVTLHSNYYKVGCKKAIEETYFLIEQNQEIEFTNEFVHTPDTGTKVIHTEVTKS